jgi:hypothetical protein
MVVPVLARLLSTGRRGPLTRPPANPTSYPLGPAFVRTNDLNSRAYAARSHCSAIE